MARYIDADSKYYINQLLNNYKKPENEPTSIYSVVFQVADKEKYYKHFEHNDGVDQVKRYIKYLENRIEELENKIEELECIQSIIDVAKMIGKDINVPTTDGGKEE